MSNIFIGEIRGFANSFCPAGWLPCNGALVSIGQYQALFAVIGTAYGGDGVNTFALPNLQGTAMLGAGTGPGLSTYPIGEHVGDAAITLTNSQMPQHNHTVTGIIASPGGTYAAPINQVSHLSRAGSSSSVDDAYSDQPANAQMAVETLAQAGHSTAHENRQPLQVFVYGIAWDGVFPTPS